MLNITEEKRINDARDKMKSNYVKKRKEILESKLNNIEKKEKLAELLSETKQIDTILLSAKSLDDISEEDRESLGIVNISEQAVVDENVVNTLVEIFANKAKEKEKSSYFVFEEEQKTEQEEIDTSKLEEELRKYFTEHYSDLLYTGYNKFLSEFTKMQDKVLKHNEDGDFVEIAEKCNIDPKKFEFFGSSFTVQDGFVAQEDKTFGEIKVHYTTPKAINNRISKLYNDIIYRIENGNNGIIIIDDFRKIKNKYLKYAEENGIEIENKDVLEELEVDNAKVQGIAKYINKVLNEREDAEQIDNTEIFAKEITKEYSKIMNLSWYSFDELESVKSIVGKNESIDKLHLKISKDSITYPNEFRPDIAYGTEEYIKNQYENIMVKVKQLHSSNAFINSKFEVLKANKEKQALRKYIQENGIEGIDISIPQVEVNHDMTKMIADALIEQYWAGNVDKETMRAKILSKLEDNWSEIMTEFQCVDVNDLFKDEMEEMGNGFVDETLYVKDDFVHLSDYSHITSKCIFATPEALKNNISEFDKRISNRDYCFDEEKGRKVLEEYAKKQGIELDIPDVEVLKAKRQQEIERFSFGPRRFGTFGTEFIPDDPTAREKINSNDTIPEVIYKVSEGVPGALAGITELLKEDESGIMLVLSLDDMNIRGSQIWEAYKYLYNEDGKKFAEAVENRDIRMIDFINQELATVDGEKAVLGGASFDRSKNPSKYRFTEKEVEQLKEEREIRIAKEKEQREKMIENSPAKKNRATKRLERQAKRKAFKQKLIDLGKRSISKLDEELTALQQKEKQAKELCEQYEEQLPDKHHQEL